MSLTITENSTTDYTPPEAGTFTARLASLIDLGTQTNVWEGEEKRTHKVLLSFEITDSENRRSDGSPHTINKRFTASLHPKAGLRKFLESWRGKPFTAEELKAFDTRNLLGLSCLVGVVHETKGDKTYANLASVMKLPKGMPAGAGELNPVAFDLAAPDWTVFAGLSSRLQGQIADSPEYQAIQNKPKAISVGSPATATATAPVAVAPVPVPVAVAPAAAQPAPPAYATEFAPDFDPDMDIPF